MCFALAPRGREPSFTSTFQLAPAHCGTTGCSPAPGAAPCLHAFGPFNDGGSGGGGGGSHSAHAHLTHNRRHLHHHLEPVEPAHARRILHALVIFRTSYIRWRSVPSISVLSKICGKVWNALPAAYKRVWGDCAGEALRTHRERYPEWRWVACAGGALGLRRKGNVKDGEGGGSASTPPLRGSAAREGKMMAPPLAVSAAVSAVDPAGFLTNGGAISNVTVVWTYSRSKRLSSR